MQLYLIVEQLHGTDCNKMALYTGATYLVCGSEPPNQFRVRFAKTFN